jgi:hypothetical protein
MPDISGKARGKRKELPTSSAAPVTVLGKDFKNI